MRPEDFSPGNFVAARRRRRRRRRFNEAGGFLPRKHDQPGPGAALRAVASMRPEDFSPGNARKRWCWRGGAPPCFNEAGGFLPRKQTRIAIPHLALGLYASMRPEDFSPGNSAS